MRFLKNRFLLALLGVCTIIAAIPFALPWLVEQSLTRQLARQGLEFKAEDIDINLISGELAIVGASARNGQGKGFTVRNASFTLRYQPLIDNRLHFEKYEVHGLMVDVERSEDGQFIVAGILLPSSAGSDSSSEWGIGLDNAIVTDTRFQYSDKLLNETLLINASSVSDLASWSPDQAINIAANASIGGGSLIASGSIRPFGERIEVDMQLRSQSLPVQHLRPYLGYALAGELDADLNVQLTYQAEATTRLQLEGKLEGRQVQAEIRAPLLVSANALNWQGGMSAEVAPGGVPVIELTSSVSASGLELEDKDREAQVLQVAGVDLQNISLTDARHLSISGVVLSGMQADLVRDEDGHWDFLESIRKKASGDDESSEAEPYSFDLNELKIGGNSVISISDKSVKPAFETRFSELEFNLDRLDSRDPEFESPVSINTRVGRYGSLGLKGTASPLQASPAVTLKGKFSGLDMVPLGGYTRELIGYRIKQGTVTSDVDVRISDENIASSFDLVLNKIKVVGIKGRTTQLKDQLGMSLPAALKLMRDRDDNIRLKLPVNGPLDNPDLGLENVIRKAMMKAVQFGLLSFYSPLGVINVADKVLQFATALRFKPIVFAPATVLLSSPASRYLDGVAEQLTVRPQLQVSVCGYATESDRQALAEIVAAKRPGLIRFFRGNPEAEDVSEEEALDLATKRGELVADYLLARGMSEEQLIPCEPTLDLSEPAEPRVELNL